MERAGSGSILAGEVPESELVSIVFKGRAVVEPG